MSSYQSIRWLRVGRNYTSNLSREELQVAETYVPLLKAKKLGAVKLDLVLRGIALLPQHVGHHREPGVVLPEISYQDLHDLCRVPTRFSMTTPEDQIDDRQILRLKRNWVGKQLKVLEQQGAIRRQPGYGDRPRIIVQRDHGSTGPIDDPDGSPGNSYITISGPVIAKWLKYWGTPEVAAYLAAMVADRYAQLKNPDVARGGATWFQTLDWFADPNGYRPPGHVRMGFSPRTLQRGFVNLRKDGLITWEHRSIRPDKPGHRFRSGRRNIYTNHFDQVDAEATEQTIAAAKT